MSITKELNYGSFRDSSTRVFSSPHAFRRSGSNTRLVKSSNISSVAAQTYSLLLFSSDDAKCGEKKILSRFVHARLNDREQFYIFSSRGSTIIQPLNPEASNDFELLKSRVHGFLKLERGWDTYEAEAPSSRAVMAALKLVNQLENCGIVPKWVTPTCDASILMRYRQGDVWYDWEFHSDGDIAVMSKPLFEKETYYDVSEDQIASFFTA
jgi:hypothetical protein